jgi:hypothetical protein
LIPFTIGMVWALEAPWSGRLEYTSTVLAVLPPLLVVLLVLLLLLPHAAIPVAAAASRQTMPNLVFTAGS